MAGEIFLRDSAYLKETPYCATVSYPDFHTSVTSQELVAWSLQERNAETALPPTIRAFVSRCTIVVDDKYRVQVEVRIQRVVRV